MIESLRIEAIASQEVSLAERREIQRLCDEAYGENLSHLFAAYRPDFHVLARLGDEMLIGHAMVVTRWLQAGTCPLLRTGYVELMATHPAWQGKGVGRAVMQVLTQAIAGKRV